MHLTYSREITRNLRRGPLFFPPEMKTLQVTENFLQHPPLIGKERQQNYCFFNTFSLRTSFPPGFVLDAGDYSSYQNRQKSLPLWCLHEYLLLLFCCCCCYLSSHLFMKVNLVLSTQFRHLDEMWQFKPSLKCVCESGGQISPSLNSCVCV